MLYEFAHSVPAPGEQAPAPQPEAEVLAEEELLVEEDDRL